MAVTYVSNKPAVAHIRFDWSGMIGRDLDRRLRTLQYRARSTAGFRTGHLRASIEIERSVIRNGLQGRVGSPVRYAAAHHEGARPHAITPRKKGGKLRFVIGGRVVFASRVNHPGNRPNPYLARWLREAVR